MAILKEITTHFGVVAGYHAISKVNFDLEGEQPIAHITLQSHVSLTAKLAGAQPLASHMVQFAGNHPVDAEGALLVDGNGLPVDADGNRVNPLPMEGARTYNNFIPWGTLYAALVVHTDGLFADGTIDMSSGE